MILLVDRHTSLRFAYICQMWYNLRLGLDIVFRRRSIVKKDGLCRGSGDLRIYSLMVVRLTVAYGEKWVDDRPRSLVVVSLKFLVRLCQGVAVLLSMTDGKLVLLY